MSVALRQGSPPAIEYARMVWERAWLIALLIVAGLAAAAWMGTARPPATYSVTVPVEVRSLTLDGTSPVSSSLRQVPPAEVDAARSVEVAASVARQLGMSDAGTDLLDRLTVVAAEDSPVIYLTMTGEGPKTLTELKVYAKAYVGFRQEQDQAKLNSALRDIKSRIDHLRRRLNVLSTRLQRERRENDGVATPLTSTRYQAASDLFREHVALREEIVLGSALADTRFRTLSAPFTQRLDPVPTDTLRFLLFPLAGAALGVAIALTLGVIRRPRIYGRQHVEELEAPVLATIPQVARNRAVRRQPLLVQRASPEGSEAIGMLRAELHMSTARTGSPDGRIVAIVSASSGDGKSTIATNLAASYAGSGSRTVVFRADVLAQPRRERRKAGDIGTLDVNTPMKKRAHPAGFEEIFLLPGDDGWRQELIEEAPPYLADHYDMIVIDTPPLLHSADGVLLSAQAQDVVLVVRDGVSLQEDAVAALDLLRRHRVNVVGVVLNGHKHGPFSRGSSYTSSRPRAPLPERELSPYDLNERDREPKPVGRDTEDRDAPPSP